MSIRNQEKIREESRLPNYVVKSVSKEDDQNVTFGPGRDERRLRGFVSDSGEHVGRVLVRLVDVFLEVTPARRCSEGSCASED